MNPLPRHVICLLGPENWLKDATAIVQRFGKGFTVDEEYSQARPDNQMQDAFEASYERITPTMLDDDWTSIRAHQCVLYFLSPSLPKESALELSAATLDLTSELLKYGGLAAKSESAGLAHGRDHWLDLSASLARRNAAEVLTSAWVRRPLSDGNELYSCGMHLLGKPDVSHRGTGDVYVRTSEIDLALGQIMRDPYRTDATEPCERYENDDFFFNPYGYVVIAGDA